MAKRGSVDVAFVLLGGRNIQGALTTFTAENEAVVEETTVLGNAWVQNMYAGLRSGKVSQDGFFDDAVGGWHEAAQAAFGTTVAGANIMTYGLEGTATGSRFVGWENTVEVKYVRQAARGALTKAHAEYKADGTVDEGVTLWALNSVTTTGNSTGTPVDNAVSSTGGVAYLQLMDSTQIPLANLSFKIRHSSDNVTYADLLTFATPTANQFADRQITTGTIERYTAVKRDWSGSTAGRSITFFSGIVRGITSAT